MAQKTTVSVQSVEKDTLYKNQVEFGRYLATIIGKVSAGVSTTPVAPKPVTREDLPPDAQAILGVVCKGGDCEADQPLCPPDPRITCQLIPADPSLTDWVKDWILLPWRIANAKKGDLIMSPGGGNGVISTLMSQLQPPQHYTHMGIMTRDCVEVRHATVSDDWLQDHPNGTIPLDGPEPTDGFQPDALRYGWPGTITQSISDAYQGSQDSSFPGIQIMDAESGKWYPIHALSFDPSVVNTEPEDSKPPIWQTIQCLVVSPCPESVEVRAAVSAIADEVKAIRGHYRFYSYTDASICLNPKYFGPPRFEGMQPDSKNPCASVNVDQTIPVVCSTLIWAAVQRLNNRGTLPNLILDSAEETDPNSCPNTLIRKPTDDKPGGVFDGLFNYDESQRQKAALKLYEYLYEEVKDKTAAKIPAIVKALGGIVLSVSAGIAYVSGPLGALAALLGISAEDASTLVDWLTDMPDDVANQVVNAFAFDWCDTAAKDSDKWKSPGTGRSVSPDNIVRSWMNSVAHSTQRAFGLYGQNRTANVRPPKWVLQPIQAWAVSPGPAGMQGIVTFLGKPINGAEIKVCCVRALSTRQSQFGIRKVQVEEDGVYKMTPPAGNYMAAASYEDPSTGVLLQDSKPVVLPFQQLIVVNFELQPPPASNREVIVTGKMDIVSRVAFGHDWWGHPQFELPHLRVGPYGNPFSSNPADVEMGKSDHKSTSQQLADYGSVRLNVDVFAQTEGMPPNSVTVNWFTAIFDGDDQKVSTFLNGTVIEADDTASWVVDLTTAGAWPDHAHIEFSILNSQQR
jgi:hypothetical protein